ncbi:uncharacterized protein LOC125312723 [Rhodamnia argentea]|uniref:Uncharacterized protein LOC125312723 n=1 Tax=Rhodamnia argentea TaxID=178133 RepID=A0ABM3GTX4_9MYRT|nr:uncharacterized protein LOC125312723 [Rhodamnia argentea]
MSDTAKQLGNDTAKAFYSNPSHHHSLTYMRCGFSGTPLPHRPTRPSPSPLLRFLSSPRRRPSLSRSCGSRAPLASRLLNRVRTVSARLKDRQTLSQSITACTSSRLLSDVASRPLPWTATGDSPPASASPGPRSSGSSGKFEHNANSSSVRSSLKDPELLDFEVASITLISIIWTQVISGGDVAVGMQHHRLKLDEMSFLTNMLVCNLKTAGFAI